MQKPWHVWLEIKLSNASTNNKIITMTLIWTIIRNLVMKTLLSGFRPTVPVASSSRTSYEDKSFFLPQGDTHTLPAPPTALPPTGLALQCQIQMYDGIREFCYPDSAYVDCTRWLLSPKTTSKIKRLLSELPTLSQYNTLTFYDGSNIYKSVQSQ